MMSSSQVFDRQEKILQFLSQNNKMTIGALAEKLKVSDWTVRRDLTELEQRQQVRRIHGGAVLMLRPEDLQQREFDAENQAEAKARIGKAAIRRRSGLQGIRKSLPTDSPGKRPTAG